MIKPTNQPEGFFKSRPKTYSPEWWAKWEKLLVSQQPPREPNAQVKVYQRLQATNEPK